MLVQKLFAMLNLAAVLTFIAVSQARAQKLELVVQTGHSDSITSIAYSPDGKTLASAGEDQVIKLWSVESGAEIKTLAGHSNLISSIAFAPDGKMLASASDDQTIKLWNVETGAEIKTLGRNADLLISVAFSPDGKVLASGSSDKTVKLWNVETGAEIKTLAGHVGFVQSVAFAPNGKILASASWDETIKLWNVNTGVMMKTLTGHSDSVVSIVYSPDGKMLASASWDKTVKLWNAETGAEIKTLDRNSKWVNSVAFAPNGKVLASAGLDNTIKFWNVETGAEIKTSLKNVGFPNSIVFAPDGKTLASASFDQTIKLWNVETKTEIKTLAGHSSLVESVAYSPDGKILASADRSQIIKLWNIETGAEIKPLAGHSGSVESVAFAPDGKTLASAGFDKTIKLWNVETGTEIKTLAGHSGSIISIAFAPDGKMLASVSQDQTIKLWNVETGAEIRTLVGQVSQINLSVAFAPDGKTLASVDNDNLIKLWGVEKGTGIKTFNRQLNWITVIAFAPDGKTLASAGLDNTIKLWNVETGAVIKTLNGHSEKVEFVTFAPDGKNLASASADKTIKLWNLETGAEVKTLVGHSSKVNSLAYSPDGKRISSGSSDTKIKIWDVKTGTELATLIAVDEKGWVVIDRDGRFDASDGALKLMHYSFGLEIINLEQFRDEYFEPGLLAKIMNGQKLRAVVSLKNAKLPPDVVSQSVEPGSSILKIKLKNRGGGIGETRVLVNGKLVTADARPASLKENPFVDAAEIAVDLKNSAFLAGKENEIVVAAANIIKEINRGNITSRGAKLLWTPDGKDDYQLPTLYAVVGGVSDYAGDKLDLKFAAKDAEDFAAALRLGANRLFCQDGKPCLDKVNITTLSTSGNDNTVLPTKDNFKKEFARIAAVAKPTDIVVVYLSGHGVSIDGKDSYLYLTQNAESQTAEDLAKNYQTSAISSDELLCWLTTNQCDASLSLRTADGKPQFGNKALQQVIILDTCAAGTAGKKLSLTASRSLTTDQRRAIEFLKDKSGTHILMGSTADAPSYEASKFGQGLLTRSLLEGLSGAALDKINGFVDVRTLFAYAEKTVPTLAKNIGGVQKPVVSSPTGKTFYIGQMSGDESKTLAAKLPREKPYVLRPNFINGDDEDNLDTLGINLNLAKLLNDENSPALMRGNSIALIYLDDNTFPGAFIPTGKYTINGETITVKGALRGENQRLPFEVTAAKNEIVEKLRQTIRAELGKIK